MKTIEQERQDLVKDIEEMKNGSFEQMFLVTVYSLDSYFKSLLSFGYASKVTRDNLNVIKEMFNIIRTERMLLNYILRNVEKFDVYAAQDVVGMLDQVNDKTVEYYYDVINDIEDAAEMGVEFRGYRPRNGFPTLIDDASYAGEVVALSENLDSLKDFLGFEEEFWNFIKDKTKKVDTSLEIMEKMTYAIPVCDSEGLVVSLQVMLPVVTNLASALLAIKLYKKAYEIYKNIGKKYSLESEDSSISLQEEYRKKYLPQKAKDMLDLKNVKY